MMRFKYLEKKYLNGQNVSMHQVTNSNLIEFLLILYELASLFHSYWNLGRDNPDKRFINDQKKIDTDDKLIFLKAISNTIKSGMDIVGVSVPEKM